MTDQEIISHRNWLGYVQPVGLVVSPPALCAAQAYINRNTATLHETFLEYLEVVKQSSVAEKLRRFTSDVLDWQDGDLLDVNVEPSQWESLEIVLHEYGETLRPTHIVPNSENGPMLLASCIENDTDFDEVETSNAKKWQASAQQKFERLLRGNNIPIGIIFNGSALRLVYAPRGESCGYITFKFDEMRTVAGRLILAGLHLLLQADRLFNLGKKQRLPHILEESRKYQNEVSTQLAEQVMLALFVLLRGFQSANAAKHGELLKKELAENPNQVYRGLLTVLLRLVFILYAEDRSLMSNDSVYAKFYSVTGLFEKLRSENGRFHDTMELRYGAWSQLLALFRMVHEGAICDDFYLPERKGHLFDPERFPFLEGGKPGSSDDPEMRVERIPRISDKTVYEVLQNLLILDGERLSYRTLDVEQIGSVYEAIMGFHLEVADGLSIAIKATDRGGAPVTINLEEFLKIPTKDRAKKFKEWTDQSITGQGETALKNAKSTDDLLAAIERKIDTRITPNPVFKGAMILQPSDERRRSGSHYTPRLLTEPIVRTTLKPILATFGENIRPENILNMKVCDPAMGSGAFLVETCRQLGDELVTSWHRNECVPTNIPKDEDELLYARRIVAQRCLYGVDINPIATDLAKLSLWLVTLAKEHPFTFLDHCFRSGDSLVGLSTKQITGFHWTPTAQQDAFRKAIQKRIEPAIKIRKEILNAPESCLYGTQETKLKSADNTLELVRFVGDTVIAAFFSEARERPRLNKLAEWRVPMSQYLDGNLKAVDLDTLRPKELAEAVAELRNGVKPVKPFHWEIEFPEVFTESEERKIVGFDAVVGNPPFAGKNNLAKGTRKEYPDFLKTLHEESHGNSDVVAHFFRRAFGLLKDQGTSGLIATNTIAQGDTRSTGLRWICTHGGTIFEARRRVKWPGMATVVVSVAHIYKHLTSIPGIPSPNAPKPFLLDGKNVPTITAYLFHQGGHESPNTLKANENKTFQGSSIVGMGFTFDDTSADPNVNSIQDMNDLINNDLRNKSVIFPYIGGEEINSNPSHYPHRHVINFELKTEEEARQWPKLFELIEKRVKPNRLQQNRDVYALYWWRYAEPRPALYETISHLKKVLVNSQVSSHLAFAMIPSNYVYANTVVVFPFETYAPFAVLQSRVHEIWTRFQASSMKDDLRYTPSDCFETFPFPIGYETSAELEAVGKEYYEYRAQLMVEHNEGLTETYNRFHKEPDESDSGILQLRKLHEKMDQAVLNAYGWSDVPTACEFLLDFEDDEEDEQTSTSRRRRKPFRYRWPDEVRDDVLARLLDLNQQRAKEEAYAGTPTRKTAKKATKKAPRSNRLPGM